MITEEPPKTFLLVVMERTRLCGLILQENFGDPVAQVGTYLMKNGSRPLSSIIRDCNCNRSTVSYCFAHAIKALYQIIYMRL